MDKNYKKISYLLFSSSKIAISFLLILLLITISVSYMTYCSTQQQIWNYVRSHFHTIIYDITEHNPQVNSVNNYYISTRVANFFNNNNCTFCHIGINTAFSGNIANSTFDGVANDIYWAVITEDGKIIADSKKIKSLTHPKELETEDFKLITNLSKIKKRQEFIEVLSDNYYRAFFTSTLGAKQHITLLRIPATTVKLAAFKTASITFLKLFCLLCALAAVYFVTIKKAIYKPFNSILSTVEKIKKGELKENTSLNDSSEFKSITNELLKLNEIIKDKEEKILRKNTGLEYINEFLSCINKSTNVADIIGYFGKYLNRILSYRNGTIWILSDDNKTISEIYCLNGIGNKPENSRELNTPLEKTSLQLVIDKGSTIVRNIKHKNDNRYLEDSFLFKHKINYVCYVPLLHESRIIGILTLGAENENVFSKENLTLIEFFCKNVCVSIQNSKLMSSLSDSRKQISSIFRITKILASSLDVRDVFCELASETKNLIEFGRMALVVPSVKNKSTLNTISIVTDNTIKTDNCARFNRENTSMDIVLETGQPFLRRDTQKEHFFIEDEILLKKGVRSYITYPVRNKGKIVGTLNLGHKMPNFYNSNDLERIKPVAEQIGIAIENSMLFEEIKKSREEWEMTFDAVSDYVAIISLNSVIVKVNKALADFFALSPKDIIGKKCYEIFHHTDHCHNACPHNLMKATGKTAFAEIEDEKTGKCLFIAVSPITNSKGKTTAILHVTRNITEEKKLKSQLVQAEKMASIGQLVSGVAHELNNPLAGIIGYSQLMLKSNMDSGVKKKIDRILTQAQRAAKIVSNLLTFARKKKPERVSLDINDIIRKTVELREYELTSNNINVNLELMEDLPLTVVDPVQIQQVLLNLIINSEHAICDAKKPSGNITISTGLIKDSNNSNIKISISDDGKGIPIGIEGKIFDPFFSTKEVGKGTGLGLSISYGIITEHGGKIYTNNSNNQGATFIIELPILEIEPLKEDKKILLRTVKNFSDNKILVVDDEDDVRSCIKEYLLRSNYEVDEAHDGKEAIEMMRQKKYNFIISDMRMPGIGGEEFYSKVKSEFPDVAKKIIFITGDNVNKNTLEFLQKNSNIFIFKPFELQQLDSYLYKLSAA